MSDRPPGAAPLRSGPTTGVAAVTLRGGITVAAATLRRLGPHRHRIADVVGMAGWALDPGRRRTAAANHLRLGAPTAREARRRTRASFREFARTNLDFVWALGMSRDDVRRHSRLDGAENITRFRDAGSGGVLALMHFGSWDFAALMAWALEVELTTVMAPVGVPAITDLVVWARERNALEVYPPEHAARGLLRALRRGRFVAMLGDLPAGGPQTVVRYCGGPVSMSLAPAWLALRTGAPLIPVECRRGGRREPHYLAIAHPPLLPAPGEEASALTQRLASVLEVGVRRHPEQWYPFRTVYTD